MTALRATSGAAHSKLLSVAGERGSRVVGNEEMCSIIDSTPEWIEQRTGILQRRWARDDETALSMAVAASRRALERAGLEPSDVDAVIVATVSHFQQTPAMACLLARELDMPAPTAFDISAACAGFSHAASLADSMVRTGSARHVLIVGVETLTRLTDFTDRSTAFLFSDGAGAAVVGPSDHVGVGPVVWGSDPAQSDVISIDDWTKLAADQAPAIRMEGNAVFRWATTFIAGKALETLEAAGLSAEDLDVFIPHQANNRITDSMLRRLKLPEHVTVARDIKTMGNASAASIPLAMDALLASGQAKSGQTALTIGFGAGLVYAGQVVVLP